jgi:hypothetical protein
MHATFLGLLALSLLTYADLAPLLSDPSAELVPGEYIVVYKDEVSASAFQDDLLQARQNYVLQYEYRNVFQGFAAALSDEQVEEVRGNPLIKYVEVSQVFRALEEQQACTPAIACFSWGLTRVCQRQHNVVDMKYTGPVDLGKGSIIYVVDTGILTTHQDFGGRSSWGFKADPTWSSTDVNGHGTHCASTAMGSVYGVARSATSVAVKVLSDRGSGTTQQVISGLEYVIAQHNGGTNKKSVINMSLGGGQSTAMNDAANACVNAGIATAVAAGNSNTNACTASPAAASEVVAVGATDKGVGNTDIRSYFSNYGNCVKIWAPGSDITAAYATSNTAYASLSGTSMASPHVAGILALWRADNPAASAKEIQSMVVSSGTNGLLDLACPSGSAGNICRSSPNLQAWNGCTH